MLGKVQMSAQSQLPWDRCEQQQQHFHSSLRKAGGVPHAVPLSGSRPGKGRSESQMQQKQVFFLPANIEPPLLYGLESYNLPDTS